VFCVGFMRVSAVRKGDIGFLYDHSSQVCVGVGHQYDICIVCGFYVSAVWNGDVRCWGVCFLCR
jgi:hypothetical protein